MKKILKSGSYIAAAVLCVLVFVFSISTLLDKGDNYKKSDSFDVENAYKIIETIAKESRPRTSLAHLNALNYLKTTIRGYGAEVIEMDYITTYDDVLKFGGYGGRNNLVPDTLVKNLLVEFKGTESDDVLIFQAHTDSVPMGAGAYDDAVPVSAMAECIRWIVKNNITFKNTVVFLFTDGEEEGLLGAQMFASNRGTYNAVDNRYVNLMDKTKFVLNFEARGTGGTCIMFETTKGNFNSVKNFAKINKNVYTNSIANFVYNQMPNGTDFSAFSNRGVQGLNFANIGEGMNYHTKFDNTQNVDKSVIAQNGQVMQSALEHFGNLDLNAMYETTDNAVFFSYLNIFTIYYSKFVAVVFGILILLLLAGAAYMNKRNKKYSLKEFLFSLLSNLIALAGAVLCVFLIKTLFGLIPSLSRILSSSSYNNYLVMFGYLFVLIAAYSFLNSLFNKIFKVTSSEYNMLANCALIALLGSILSFVMPELSFILAAPGFIGAIVIFVSATIKNFNFNKLALGVLPFLMMLPLAISITMLASDALGLSLAWIFAIPSLLAFAFITPYTMNLPKLLNASAEKIKSDNKTARAVKFSASKSHHILALAACVTGLILFVTGAVAPVGIATNVYGKASGRSMLFVDDTIIFDKNLNSDETRFLMYDKAAYEYLNRVHGVKGTFDSKIQGYILDISGSVKVNEPVISTANGDGYFEISVKKAFGGMFTISFPLINNDTDIEKIEVTDSFGTYIFTKTDFINNMKSSGEIKFRSYSDSAIKVYTKAQKLDFNYKENADVKFTEISKLNEIRDVEKYFLTGIQLSKSFSI